MIQNEDEIEILESDESIQTGKSLDSEEANQQNLGLRRKRMRILSDSESGNERSIPRSDQNSNAFCGSEIAVDGIIWTKVQVVDHLSTISSKKPLGLLAT